MPAARLPADITIKRSDFRKLPVDDGAVDSILTDPPWDQHHRHLLEPMAEWFHRWLKPGGMLLCYVGSFALPFFLDAFRTAGLTYQWLSGSTNFAKADESHVPYGIRYGAMKNGGRFSAALRPLLLFSKGKDFHLNLNPSWRPVFPASSREHREVETVIAPRGFPGRLEGRVADVHPFGRRSRHVRP